MSIREYFNVTLSRKYKQLFEFQRIVRKRFYFKSRMRRKIRSNKKYRAIKNDKTYLNKSKAFLKKNFNGYKNTDWHIYYSTFNNIKAPNYIPSDLYFTLIEPTLNKQELFRAHTDKNSYECYFKKEELPETIFKIINGEFFDENNKWITKKEVLKRLIEEKNQIVFKPAILSGAGKNVIIDFAPIIANELKHIKYETGSYIIQKKIEQHKKMAQFHPHSVNTCRLLTSRINDEVVVLSAYFRIGRDQNKIDNGMAGGIMCGINEKGIITDFAFDFTTAKMLVHPNTGIEFKGFVVPAYSDVRNFCMLNHKKFLHHS